MSKPVHLPLASASEKPGTPWLVPHTTAPRVLTLSSVPCADAADSDASDARPAAMTMMMRVTSRPPCSPGSRCRAPAATPGLIEIGFDLPGQRHHGGRRTLPAGLDRRGERFA